MWTTCLVKVEPALVQAVDVLVVLVVLPRVTAKHTAHQHTMLALNTSKYDRTSVRNTGCSASVYTCMRHASPGNQHRACASAVNRLNLESGSTTRSQLVSGPYGFSVS